MTGWHGALLCLFLRVVGTFSQVLPSSPHPLPSSAGLSPVLVGVLNLIEAERPPVINGVIIQFPSHLLFFPVITHASHSCVFLYLIEYLELSRPYTKGCHVIFSGLMAFYLISSI